MKYLLYAPVSPELSSYVASKTSLPEDLALHMTLFYFQMTSSLENALCSTLDFSSCTPYELSVSFLDTFHLSGVLRLSPSLQSLHQHALSLITPHLLSADMRYFGTSYTPHVTVTQDLSTFKEDFSDAVGLSFLVDSLYLAKKTSSGWVDVCSFLLGS